MIVWTLVAVLWVLCTIATASNIRRARRTNKAIRDLIRSVGGGQ